MNIGFQASSALYPITTRQAPLIQGWRLGPLWASRCMALPVSEASTISPQELQTAEINLISQFPICQGGVGADTGSEALPAPAERGSGQGSALLWNTYGHVLWGVQGPFAGCQQGWWTPFFSLLAWFRTQDKTSGCCSFCSQLTPLPALLESGGVLLGGHSSQNRLSYPDQEWFILQRMTLFPFFFLPLSSPSFPKDSINLRAKPLALSLNYVRATDHSI